MLDNRLIDAIDAIDSCILSSAAGTEASADKLEPDMWDPSGAHVQAESYLPNLRYQSTLSTSTQTFRGLQQLLAHP